MTYLSTSTVRLRYYSGAPCSPSSCVQGLGAPRFRGTWELLPSCLTLVSDPHPRTHLAPVGHRGTRKGDFEGPGSCTRGPNWGLGRFSWPWGGGLGGRSARVPPTPAYLPTLEYPCGKERPVGPWVRHPPSRTPSELGTTGKKVSEARRVVLGDPAGGWDTLLSAGEAV